MDFLPIILAFIAGSVLSTVVVTRLERQDARQRVWRVCQDHQSERYYTEHDPKNITRWIEMLAHQHEQPCMWGTYTRKRDTVTNA